MTDMVSVTSTLIESVGYNLDREEMTVQFHNGAEYVYSGVPLLVYEALVGAKSAGAFFIKQVKGKYGVIRR